MKAPGTGSSGSALEAILVALRFSADKHRDQRRKDPLAAPYINHIIDVAEILVRTGGIEDAVTLQAAVLHDTLEDTTTTEAELRELFGSEVCRIVVEVTDDKSLPNGVRKRLQIEHAPHLSMKAQQIKIADKISNVGDVVHSPPNNWSMERRLDYLDWAESVVAGCRGCNAALERRFTDLLDEGRRLLAEGPAHADG